MTPRPGPRHGGSVALLLLRLLAPDAARAQRSVADLLGRPATPDGEPTTILYTGIDKRTLAANFDFAGEKNDPALVALGRASPCGGPSSSRRPPSPRCHPSGLRGLRLEEGPPHGPARRVLQ